MATMTQARARVHKRAFWIGCVVLFVAATAIATQVRSTEERTQASDPPVGEVTGSITDPATGSVIMKDRTIQGSVHLLPGTFALVTIWSASEQVEYGVQLIGLSGPFRLTITNDIPNTPGEYEIRLWAISTAAAEFFQTHWPPADGNCARGFAGLDQQRSSLESDPFRLVSQVQVHGGAEGIDELERAKTGC